MEKKRASKTIIRMGLCVFFASCTPLLAISTAVNVFGVDPWDSCSGPTQGGTALFDLEFYEVGEDPDLQMDIGLSISNQYLTGPDGQYFNFGFSGSSLSGMLWVDLYRAMDWHSGSKCYHEADIAMYYERDVSDPVDLHWIQLYSETGDCGNDVLRVDSKSSSNPNYYQPGYGPWTPTNYTLLTDWDMTFTDGPYDRHTEIWGFSGTVEFYTLLASYSDIYWVDNTRYQDVTIYDMVYWGYSGYCVPAPGALILACLGLPLVHWIQRRRRPAN